MNNHMVLDVSSDEDYDKGENFSLWLDEYLQVSDEKVKSTALRNSNSSDPMVEIKDEDDDDCVILDCDPTVKETVIDTFETDEVLVTGQKGEIACRDFPHPRHDCAKYQFKSTPHQQHCEMCHCYVCDTRAPCPYWYTGFSNVDHCHANDKEEIWKTQREWFRAENMLPRPVSTPASIIPQMGRVTLPISVPSSPITQFGVRACSTSTKVATHPNTRPGYRTEPSGPPAVQSYPNHRGGSYNGKPSPKKAVSSYPYTYTRRPRGVYRPENFVQNIAQGSQATRNAPPAASLSARNVPLAASQPASFAPAASQAAGYAPPAASQAAHYTPPGALQPTRNTPPAASLAARYAPPESSQARRYAPPVALQPIRNTPPASSQARRYAPPADSQPTRNTPPAASQPTRNAPPAVSLPTRNAPPMASQPTRNTPPAASQARRYAPPVALQPIRNTPPASSQARRYAPPADSQPTRNAPPMASQPTRDTPPAVSQPTRNTPPASSEARRYAPPAVSQPTRNTLPAASQARHYAPPAVSQPTHNTPPAAAQAAHYAPPAAAQAARYAPPAASQPTRNTPPSASQGNPQRIVTGYISSVPESPSKVYARQFNRNMYSAYHQSNAVPSESPNPPANQQQQQSRRSSDKVLLEFEDWLLDESTPTGPLCPLFSQDNATPFKSNFETFLK